MVGIRSETCRVAFKEWAGVCDALVQGRQTVIMRKGGISETAGPGEFVPEYSEFWLYPTRAHQAAQGLRTGTDRPPTAHPSTGDGAVPIRGLVVVDLIGHLDSENALSFLEDFHILTPETIATRFHYRRPGLWVLGARVWLSCPGFTVATAPEHAGCKTWVVLDEPLSLSGLQPVLDDDEWGRRRDRLRSVLVREK